MKFEAFISFKNSDKMGNPTQDSAIAEQLYKALCERGIATFFSNVRLLEFGEAAYKEAIEKALDDAKVLIVIGSKLEYIESGWPKYEWNSFHEDILAKDKPEGSIVPYLGKIERSTRPRALRNYQTFEIGVNTIAEVVDFVYNILHAKKGEDDIAVPVVKDAFKPGSTYKADYKDEHTRLKTQAINTRNADMPAVEYVVGCLDGHKKYILDIGCAYGYVTEDRFNNIDDCVVIGVDFNSTCIDFANANNTHDNFHYELLNLEDDTFDNQLTAIMQKYSVPYFNIVFGSLVLLHLNNPTKVLRNLRKYLNSPGYIIIRGSDDGSTLTFNDSDLIEKILNIHHNTKGISDRFNGRKIYYQLHTTGYADIKMFNYVKDVAGLSYEERLDVFKERFAYRRNYLQFNLNKDPYNIQLRNELELIDYALLQLEDKFGDMSFWYCEVDFVAVGKK